MLSILHVLDSLEIGGTEWQCLSLIRHLDIGHYRNSLVSLSTRGDFRSSTQGIDAEVLPFPGFRHPAAVQSIVRLAALMRQRKVQLVQAYGFYSNVPAALAAKIARVPIFVASRRDMGESLDRPTRLLERVVFALADGIVVNAEAIRTQLRQGRLPDHKIHVIRTGVDLERFGRPGDGPVPEWAESGHVVTMIARFRKQKDHATLLRTAKHVLTTEPRAAFVLAGDGYLKESIERLASEMGISASVWFVGAVSPDKMPTFLRHVNVCVLTSRGNEGIPNVVLESMAAGKPVVATDVGGCREAVQDGVTGFLVPPGDSAQIADKVLRLLRDSNEATRMGKAGRQRAEAEFSLYGMVDRFNSLYADLTRQKVEQAIEVR